MPCSSYRFYELSGGQLRQKRVGGVDLSRCATSLQRAGSGCLFEISNLAGLKHEFMCPTAQECAAWVAALSPDSHVRQRLRFQEGTDDVEGRVGLSVKQHPSGLPVIFYLNPHCPAADRDLNLRD